MSAYNKTSFLKEISKYNKITIFLFR